MMANLTRLFKLCKTFNHLCKTKNSNYNTLQMCRSFGTSSISNGLMEFFDDEKNWGEMEVRNGRSWKKDELRIKSNSDLHKLWYVLLKERNMLLTMEHEYKEKARLMPSPERIDKILDSMENLEEVIQERNRAYYELETGETGEQKVKTIVGKFGIQEEYREQEYSIPKEVNKKWQEEQSVKCREQDIREFLVKMKEKEFLNKRREYNRNFHHVIKLLNRFPNMDLEAVKEQYPDVDIEKAKRNRKYKPAPVFD